MWAKIHFAVGANAEPFVKLPQKARFAEGVKTFGDRVGAPKVSEADAAHKVWIENVKFQANYSRILNYRSFILLVPFCFRSSP